MSELARDNVVRQFALSVFRHLYEVDSFEKIEKYLVNTDNSRVSFKDSDSKISMSSLFLVSTLEEVKKINKDDPYHSRWFDSQEFVIGGKTCFLSGEWNAPESYPLSILKLKSIVEKHYNLSIEKKDNEWILSNTLQDIGNKQNSTMKKIFFGAPGTGKSHKIDNDLFKDENGNLLGLGLKSISQDFKFRTTFHPDYDYAQFVGSYKPKKDTNGNITYSFVPQVFAKAYAAAWKVYLENQTKPEPVYLVIEEINRGNCAQIFGDIFQLLDRNEQGYSSYSIDADADFSDWLQKDSELKDIWEEYVTHSYDDVNGDAVQPVSDNKIALPPNFNILATMNTSDQSLFPMDSAFKRRFDWEYVPIDYKKTEADFTIVIGDKKYRWLDFLKKVNADIYIATESEDKQMGEFFVKPSDRKTIDLPTFCSKVLFYLWDSVYKDDDQNKKVFRFDWKFDGEEKNRPVTFQSLFEDEKTKTAIVQKMMENLNVSEKQ